MVKFYEGGLTFEYGSKLSYYALYQLKIEAHKINREIENKQNG